MEEQQIKVHAIINPISGVGSKRKIPKMIEDEFPSDRFDLAISFTEYAGHASELTKEAVDRGANTILAVGGDGTVNEIANRCCIRMPYWVLYRKVQEMALRANCIYRWMSNGHWK